MSGIRRGFGRLAWGAEPRLIPKCDALGLHLLGSSRRARRLGAPQRVLAGCRGAAGTGVLAVLSRSGEGVPLATRRTTFDKRERERSKQAKAAAKRARRQGKSGDPQAPRSEGHEGGTDTTAGRRTLI